MDPRGGSGASGKPKKSGTTSGETLGDERAAPITATPTPPFGLPSSLNLQDTTTSQFHEILDPQHPQSPKEFNLPPLRYPRPTGSIFVPPNCPTTTKFKEASPSEGSSEASSLSVPLKPADSQGNCSEDPKRVMSYEENMKKKSHIKDVLLNHEAYPDEILITREEVVAKNNMTSTESLDFLKTHSQFQVSGKSELRIAQEDIETALNGFNNMHLAHEIAVNNDFKLEVYTPPGDSLTQRIREQMKKAYWDIFDEAISSEKPNTDYCLSVFRETKAMLLGLLLPHNRGMKNKIEAFLDETTIKYEMEHGTLEISRYTDFVIHILGQLCCPIRDAQIEELKTLEKPSDLFRETMHVMEQMQLDMANFLITQIRPTIINNCVVYERRKFSNLIEIQYKLKEDSLKITRDWLSRHIIIPDREPLDIIGKAFAELFAWEEKNWPETLTLDWPRFMSLAADASRATFLGAALLNGFNAVRIVFEEDDSRLPPAQRGNMGMLRSFPILELLKVDLSLLIQNEDCSEPEKLQHVMTLLGEQIVKITTDYASKRLNKTVSDSDAEIIRGALRDCAREDNPVRLILLRRVQDYAAHAVSVGTIDVKTDFPKNLAMIQEQIIPVMVNFVRIAIHNRAVFQDLYLAMIRGEIPPPVFKRDENDVFDPNVMAVIQMLLEDPVDKVVSRKN